MPLLQRRRRFQQPREFHTAAARLRHALTSLPLSTPVGSQGDRADLPSGHGDGGVVGPNLGTLGVAGQRLEPRLPTAAAQPLIKPAAALVTSRPSGLSESAGVLALVGSLAPLLAYWRGMLDMSACGDGVLFGAFVNVVGLVFQEVRPDEVLGEPSLVHVLIPDHRRRDEIAAGTFTGPQWSIGPNDATLTWVLAYFVQNQVLLRTLVRDWASTAGLLRRQPEETVFSTGRKTNFRSHFLGMLRQAGWLEAGQWFSSAGYRTMADIKRMAPGPEKERLRQQALFESPRLYEACMRDELCG